MKDEKLFIPVLLGTLREGRRSEVIARYVLSRLERIEGVKTELIDPRDIGLQRDGYGPDVSSKYPEYGELIKKSDGLIIVSPEYNHGYPGTLKEVLDMQYGEYSHKACGIVGVSSGPFGGARMIENLAHVVKALGMVMPKKDLNVMNVQDAFTKTGKPKIKQLQKFTDDFLLDVIWLAKAMRWGRNNLAN